MNIQNLLNSQDTIIINLVFQIIIMRYQRFHLKNYEKTDARLKVIIAKGLGYIGENEDEETIQQFLHSTLHTKELLVICSPGDTTKIRQLLQDQNKST